jgi:5-methylcytosine-specific restriction endonuclease McrA
MTARELTNELAALLRKEHAAMSDFLLSLAAFDREQRWRELGHTSLFYFLRRELGLSAGAAQNRKTAAELIQRYPAVEAALRRGKLCLSTVTELSKVLTPENAADTLPRFFGLSRREAEALAVSIKPVPAPPQRNVVTAVRSPAPRFAPPEARIEPLSPAMTLEVHPCEVVQAVPRPTPVAPARPSQRDAVEPLDAERSRLHVNVSRRFLEKLDRAKDTLSPSKPGASMEEILEAGLDLVLARQAKRNGLVSKPRKTVRPSESDRIPAHVKRAVWTRAGGRCEYILESGERCGCTDQLEYDHITPRALGGRSTLANVRLACRRHNDLAARLVFGDRVMDRYTRKRGRAGSTAESVSF